MTATALAFGALYTALTIYVVAASVEFGGAMLLLAGRRLDPHDRLLNLILRYMAPTWETVLMILVVIVVGYALTFPSAVPILAPAFLVPTSIGVMAMVVRTGVFIALYLGVRGWLLRWGFAAGSVVAPVALSTFFSIWAGAGSLQAILRSPVTFAIIPLSIVVPLALGGVVLGNLVRPEDEAEAALGRRLRRLGAAAALAMLLLGGPLALALGAVSPGHLASIGRVWFIFAASGVIGFAGAIIVRAAGPRRTWLGAAAVIAQVLIALTAYGVTNGPTLGPGRPLLESAINTGPRSFYVVTVIAGLLVLLPSLTLLLFVIRPWEPGGAEHAT